MKAYGSSKNYDLLFFFKLLGHHYSIVITIFDHKEDFFKPYTVIQEYLSQLFLKKTAIKLVSFLYIKMKMIKFKNTVTARGISGSGGLQVLGASYFIFYLSLIFKQILSIILF